MPITVVTKAENRQLQNIANILATSQKMVIVTGAGISTNCGIPDFRSEQGLYALIQTSYDKASTPIPKNDRSRELANSTDCAKIQVRCQASTLPTNVKGKDLFDARIWKDPTGTAVFYKFITSLRKKIREEVKQTTPTHRFIKTIRDSHKLVRCYTQNIDGLESRLGLSMDLTRGKGDRSRFTKKSRSIPRIAAKGMPGSPMDGGCEVVPLHGDLAVLRCTLCQQTCGWDDGGREATMLKGKAPECFSCATSDQQRRDRGKRGTKIGSLRPNIVLYGEEHPEADAVGSITTHDLSLSPDVLLILGTSLHVHGLKTMVKEFARCVHARPKEKGKVIFVNLSQPSESTWSESIDYWVSMDCDEWIGSLRRHRPDIWHLQTELTARVVKKETHPKAKGSATMQSKAASPNDKENRAATGVQVVVKSPRRSATATRARNSPLGEIDSNSTNQMKERNRDAEICNDSVLFDSSQSLPTPPPSTHNKDTACQRQKRCRPLDEHDEVVTPTKKARLPAKAASENASLTKYPPRKNDQQRHRPSPSDRKRAAIKIWEEPEPEIQLCSPAR
ncbi:MAG: hypothetical protein LQ349_002675 [Xanthoria aureola]|nr:MAG: hypothetical protein LQ349_002675 [Xanthoria aureola]